MRQPRTVSAILLTSLLILSSCSSQGNIESKKVASNPFFDTEEYRNAADYYEYELPTVWSLFAADEKGIFYTLSQIAEDSEQLLEYDPVLPYKYLNIYALNGQLTGSHELDSHEYALLNICASNGVIYAVARSSESERIDTVLRLDLNGIDSKTNPIPIESFAIPDYFENVKRTAYHDGKLYIFGIHKDYIGIDYTPYLYEHDYPEVGAMMSEFDCDGTVLASYDMGSGEMAVVFDEPAIGFSATYGGKIVVSGNDNIGGFFFQEIDTGNWTVSEKRYTLLARTSTFAADGTFVILNPKDTFGHEDIYAHRTLYHYSPLSEGSLPKELFPDVLVFQDLYPNGLQDIQCAAGFTYFRNAFSDNQSSITRIKNEAFISREPAPPIRSIMVSENLVGDYYILATTPGLRVDFAYLSEDEFALNVLAQSAEYDVCVLSSRQRFSTNIKNKGAFYPLNDVPSVAEYLDACFPYLKEAATDDDGNIWMLPLSVDIPTIIYHEANCAEAGLDFANAETLIDVWNLVAKACETYGRDSPRFNFEFPVARDYSMLGYFANNDSADTAEFRELANIMKGFPSGSLRLGGYEIADVEDFLFLLAASADQHSMAHFASWDNLMVSSFFGTTELAPAYVTFICVNPYSDSLEYTLDCISSLAASLMEAQNSMMLSDPEMYMPTAFWDSIRAVCANAKVAFSVPLEIYDYDMIDYIHEIIDIETFIEGVDRKLAMYLNE